MLRRGVYGLPHRSNKKRLVPRPRVNLTRFHGVFAPNSKYRSRVTPAKCGKRKKRHQANDLDQTHAEKRAKRLSITRNGRVRYELKTPWRNGTTHVIFEPLDFISRLVALVPRPRVNLTRFHGVFAPNSKYRSRVTPARRGKRKKRYQANDIDQTHAEKRASMTWAKRLKRVFNLDVETCDKCGGDVRIIASIEDPVVIQKILAHLDSTASSAAAALLPDCRASPSLPLGLFD